MESTYWAIPITLESLHNLNAIYSIGGERHTSPGNIMSTLNDIANGVPILSSFHTQVIQDPWAPNEPSPNIDPVFYAMLDITVYSSESQVYRIIPRHIAMYKREIRVSGRDCSIFQWEQGSGYGYNSIRAFEHHYFMMFNMEVFWDCNHCNDLYYACKELGFEPEQWEMRKYIPEYGELFKLT